MFSPSSRCINISRLHLASWKLNMALGRDFEQDCLQKTVGIFIDPLVKLTFYKSHQAVISIQNLKYSV